MGSPQDTGDGNASGNASRRLLCGDCRHGYIEQRDTSSGFCLSCEGEVYACASGDCPDEGRHWGSVCENCAACAACECGCE